MSLPHNQLIASALALLLSLSALAALAVPPPEGGHSERASRAAQSAEAYLRSRGVDLDPAVPFTLDYLARRFELAPFDDAVALARRAAEASPDLAALLPLLGDPPTPSFQSNSAYQQNLQQALRCELLGPAERDELLRSIEEDLARTSYVLSHSAMALQWLRERRCISEAQAMPHVERAIRGLEAMAGLSAPGQEPALQAHALLTYIAPNRPVDPGIVEAILDAQRPDGSWARPNDGAHDIDHATMLAMWFLLEVSGRPVRDVPMIASAPAPAPAPRDAP